MKKLLLASLMICLSPACLATHWEYLDSDIRLGDFYGDTDSFTKDKNNRYLAWFKLENQRMFKNMPNVRTIKMRIILDCSKTQAGISAYQLYDKNGHLIEKKDKVSSYNEYWTPEPHEFFAGFIHGFCR
nr:surface-adhesin E family protein [Moraxella sp. CTOTU48268]